MHPVRGWASAIIPSRAESEQSVLSHVTSRFYAAFPLTALYYYRPGLGVAVTAAFGTITAVQELRHRRKPTQLDERR